MNQKSLVAILGVVVIILLGTTIYFATISNVSQPVPMPVAKQPTVPVTQPPATPPAPATSALATYTNTKYGIEFQYPKNLNVSESTDTQVNNPISVDGKTATGEDFSLSIVPSRKSVSYPGKDAAVAVGAKKLPIVDDEKQYIINENLLRACLGNGYTSYFYKSLMLNNKKVYFCVNSFDLKQIPLTMVAVAIPRDNSSEAFIEGSCDAKNNQQCLDLFEKIVSTFKFTK